MFDDYSMDPRSWLALLCLFTAFIYWNNDAVFYLFSALAACTRWLQQ